VSEIFSFLLAFASILFFAKIFGEVALKLGQSAVMGELLAGIFIGPGVLGIVCETPILSYISELGAIVLLFEVGLSTDIKGFLKVGGWATVVAFMGVITPYFLGYFIFRCFGFTQIQAVFGGAVFTATSVGITARVFIDLKYLETEEARIVLGAAVIDDIIGLGILAFVLKFVNEGIISFGSIMRISGTAILFLTLSIAAGMLIAPVVFRFVSKMKQSYMAFTAAIVFCFILSAFSIKAGLAPIIGAFIAGLTLSTRPQKEEIKRDIKPVYAFFVPVFFVMMGTNVDINIFNPFISSNKGILILTAVLFAVAFISKVVSGFAVFKRGVSKFLIGVSMVPRGEVGLIFAELGLKNSVFTVQSYTSLVAVIMLTIFVTPLILKSVILKQKSS